jgi:ketosteroid isomerase-like protein
MPPSLSLNTFSREMTMLRTLSAAAFLALMVPTIGSADDADSEKQVASLAKQSTEATLKGDTKTLDAILADDFVVINPFGELETKAVHLKWLKDGTLRFDSVESSEEKVRVYGDAAVLTVRGRVKVTFKGRSESLSVRNSEFYAKQGGKWRCVFQQVTPITAQSGEKP